MIYTNVLYRKVNVRLSQGKRTLIQLEDQSYQGL
jgi:hypothetical protein